MIFETQLSPEANALVNKTIVFLHIPKAAGSTLYLILDKNYIHEQILNVNNSVPGALSLYDFATFAAQHEEPVKLLRGHFPFGFHAFLPRQSTYITILRNPLARIVSHYNYVLNDSSHYLHKQVIEKK